MLTPPHPIAEHHDVSRFACGKPALDAWLRNRAKRNQLSSNTKTLVVVDTEAGQHRVVAFYSLAPASVVHAQLVRPLRQNAPDPVPMILLARLAVDTAYARRGIGRHLLLDAFRRCTAGADLIGGRGIVTNAKDEAAAAFYMRWKFQRVPGNPLLLVIPMELVRGSLAEASSVAA